MKTELNNKYKINEIIIFKTHWDKKYYGTIEYIMKYDVNNYIYHIRRHLDNKLFVRSEKEISPANFKPEDFNENKN